MSQDDALVALGLALRARAYRFTTITPASHARVLARAPDAEAATLRDVFGWSRPFRPAVLGPELFDLLSASGQLRAGGDLFRSAVRFSTLEPLLVVHSAYPTEAQDAVFFGPDTYRFVSLVRRTLSRVTRLVDVGCGTGIGGLAVAGRANQLVLADISEASLRLARVNARIASTPHVECVASDILAGVPGTVDAIIANPPYLVDPVGRRYRHGGTRGIALSVRIVRESIERLAPGGLLVLYTGTPVVDGTDLFRAQVEPLLRDAAATFAYEELDPDVFGDELAGPAYRDVDRIALVSLVCRVG